jgi:hypothetical protein
MCAGFWDGSNGWHRKCGTPARSDPDRAIVAKLVRKTAYCTGKSTISQGYLQELR